MLYQAYQFQDDLVSVFRSSARMAMGAFGNGVSFPTPLGGHFMAALALISRFELRHTRPAFNISSVRVGNRDVPVTEEVAVDLPFGKLLHFTKDIDTPQPRVLIVAPLSGHFSTLLAGTVRTMLSDHDVYLDRKS